MTVNVQHNCYIALDGTTRINGMRMFETNSNTVAVGGIRSPIVGASETTYHYATVLGSSSPASSWVAQGSANLTDSITVKLWRSLDGQG